jgi:uncharacterized phage protein (TIGR01671 family)
MNREIKFRAWLEGKHEGLSFTKPTMDYDVVLSKNGHWCDVESGWDIQGEYESIPIMQFTGLQDKNGKDIYEGDIVRYYNKYSKLFYTHQVMWDNKWPAFGLFEQGNEWCKEIDWVKISEIEVIGNIYENPELLTN